MDHVYCVGDEANDITMLRAAAQGFAPANCVDAVRACGATLVADCRHDAPGRGCGHFRSAIQIKGTPPALRPGVFLPAWEAGADSGMTPCGMKRKHQHRAVMRSLFLWGAPVGLPD